MNEYTVHPSAIAMLVKIRQEIMRDERLAMRLTDNGQYGSADMLATIIANIQRMEQRISKQEDDMRIAEQINKRYYDVLGDYDPDTMSARQRAELDALVAKWDEEGGAT